MRNRPVTGGKNMPVGRWEFDGFNGLVNTFALPTELRGIELASALNMEAIGKKSVRPRRGTEQLGGSLGGSKVDSLLPFKNGPLANDLLGIADGNLKKYNAITDVWDTIAAGVFTPGLRTRGTKLQGNYYLGNGVDDFTRANNAGATTFSAVIPPAGLALSVVGTPGATTYEYTVTTVTAKGESLPATNVQITTGPNDLDLTNKIKVQWTRRTETQVLGYNIYGRSPGRGVTLLIYVDQLNTGTTMEWNDDGTLSQSIYLPPDGDSTDGPKCTIWEQLRGSLVGAGVVGQEDRLFFSGTGDKFESFSPAHNGGWADVRPGDNDIGINGFGPFESKIVVAKEESIHNFFFSPTTGDALLQEVLTYVGCGAPGSMVVMENDLAFIDSDRKMRILGYEPNYTAGVRTTALSEGRVDSLFQTISPTYMSNMEAIYHNGRYILAFTPAGETKNTKIIIYDRRYLGFLGVWEGNDCHVRCWAIWSGKDNQKRLYAGGSDTDKVWEFGVGRKQYDGSAVAARILTRNEDLGNSGQQKIWKWADFRLYQIQGTLTIRTIRDGVGTLDTKSFSSVTNTGWGIVKWGTRKWGTQTGIAATASDFDQTYRKEIYDLFNSLQFEIYKDGGDDDFTLVSARGEALLLPTEVFDSTRFI